jgi:FkbM family methyltransferase
VGAIEFSAPKQFIYSIQEKFQYSNFIETGTYMGETSIWASTLFKNVFTIEVNSELSQAAERRSNGKKNISFICGDSSDRLKDISNNITGTSLYWLDGHWCGGVSKLTGECPLIAELNSILSRDEDIVLIDDARFFMGVVPKPHNPEEWPRIDQVISLLRIKYPAHEIIIEFDIIMCLPKEIFLSVQNDFREGSLESGENPGRVESVQSNLVRSALKKIFSFFASICYSALKLLQKNPDNFPVTSPAFPTILDSLPVNTLIDIGASVGDFINQMLERNNKLRVIAFEPVPEVYTALLRRYTSHSNFTAYNIALGDKDGEVEFYANEYTYSSSILPMSDMHKNEFPYTINASLVNVAIGRLDTLVDASGLTKPILVKVDVQGFEKQVIAGGHKFFSNVDYVIIEVSFVELYIGQPMFDEINLQMNQLGFFYNGNIEQLVSRNTGSILQADALYVRRKQG